ncbi:DNA-binding response regulator [Myxococcaceae bacterium JPH2]|nr:DNA-binding response regulator [Myxococcaceae bacterium JPH2]
MEPARSARALLLGADDSLAALMSDVLADLGIALAPREEPSGGGWDVVLAHVERGAAILPVLQRARAQAAQAPVLVLVPFSDERLVQLALRLGARGCFALGRPLQELRDMLRAELPVLSPSPSGGAP